ncbi:MAG TPA: hypothetical protein VNZ22_17615 [Bacillota bacterium]|nr:hypothetical protein [Bacillota bacterium]
MSWTRHSRLALVACLWLGASSAQGGTTTTNHFTPKVERDLTALSR